MNRRPAQNLTLLLGGICVLLLVLIVAFWFGLGRGYSELGPDDSNAAVAAQANVERTPFKLSAWEAFADMNERPLFNESRRPTPPAPLDAGLTDAKTIPKLNVTLSGIMLTPKARVVMIKENGKTQSTMVREGHALPGELSAWNLVQIKPRSAIFRSEAGEEAEVELIAAGNGQKPPQASSTAAPTPGLPVPGQAPPLHLPGAPAAEAPRNTAVTSAELQQRIDARRQQIREETERARLHLPPAPAQQR